MHDAPTVRMPERAGDLPGDQERIVDGQLLLPGYSLPECFPLHIRHGVPEEPRDIAGIEDGKNVGMLELRGNADFAEEALRTEAGGELGMEHLQGDGPVVAEILRQIHRGHPSPAELAPDRVAPLQCLAYLGSRYAGRRCAG